MNHPQQLVEHYCRHESARLVATLAGRFGVRHLDLIEDVVQGAFIRALRSWPLSGVPKEPRAWLYRVAFNAAMDHLRRDMRWNPLSAADEKADTSFSADHNTISDYEVSDSQLRMIFACCSDEIPRESQVALALKTLCGFGNREIARALLSSEASVAKKLVRAKQKLRTLGFDPYQLTPADIRSRLPTVQAVAYLLFNEGYYSSGERSLVREELCEEAVRLALILAEHPITKGDRSSALIALMLFHASRLEARLDESGLMLQLHEQDRQRWDYRMIREAGRWMTMACGEELSRYHVEAWIASEHCVATSYETTNWNRIAAAYAMLQSFDSSPTVQMNRAIAVSYAEGIAAGWRLLRRIPDDFQSTSALWASAAADFSMREKQNGQALEYLEKAIQLATSESERAFLRRMIGRVRDQTTL
ncbi:MAG: sigma-70 family RNA polymerase sigma factor [Planctomycetota bacterium]